MDAIQFNSSSNVGIFLTTPPPSQPLAQFFAFLKIMQWIDLGSELGVYLHFNILFNFMFKFALEIKKPFFNVGDHRFVWSIALGTD